MRFWMALSFSIVFSYACAQAKGKPVTAMGFMTARELIQIAGRVASDKLPDEVAETTPVPAPANSGVVLIMFYRVSGRLPERQVHAPHYAIHIDGRTGQVIKFWPATAQELGIRTPAGSVSDVNGPATLSAEQYAKKRDRLLEISSPVWSAFEEKRAAHEENVRPLLREYWLLFCETVLPEVAPFYLEASPKFFAWVRSAV